MTRTEVYELFLSSARSFLTINGTKVRINEQVYKKNESGFSSVILLIALQVLAVEETIKKENEFTDSAYFPKLRNLISSDLVMESLLPFDQDEFDTLWATFKIEVQEKAPNTNFLTFDIEKVGAFKNKSKPLSQALLSHRDLAVLATKFYEKNLSLTNDESILNSCISNNISLISSRGRNCCRNKILREHVLNQFQYFLSRVSKEDCSSICELQKDALSNLVVKLTEHYDIFTNESCITVFFESEGQALSFEKGVSSLNEFLVEKKYFIASQYLTMLRGEFLSNTPVEVKNAYFLSLDESFLAYLEEGLGVKSIQFSEYGSVSETPFRIYKVSDSRLDDVYLQQTRGILNKEVKKKTYDLSGGIKLGERSNVFLKGFAFNKVSVKGLNLSDGDQVEVNSIKMTIRQMLNLLDENPFDFYNVKANDVSFSFSIVNNDPFSEGLYGFNVHNNDLKLSKSVVSSSSTALVGFHFINQIPQILVTSYDLIQAFQHSPDLFVQLEEDKLEVLLNSIKRTKNLSKSQKEYFCRFIRIKKVIPRHFLSRFKKPA